MRPILSPTGSLAVASGASMALEVLTPRCLAPAVGTGVPVWTTVVGVVLVAMAAGSAWGGRLADRRRGATLEVVLLASAAAALALAGPSARAARSLAIGGGIVARAAILALCTAAPASFLLGAVAPVVTRRALAQGGDTTRTLGRLAAAGAAGGVLGTILAAQGLVAWVSTATGLGIVGGTTALAALLRCGGRPQGSGVPGPQAPRGRAPARGDAPARPGEDVPLADPRPDAAGTPIGVEAAGAPSFAALLGLAALAGAAVLALEVLALRRAALVAGSSLYAWTAVLATAFLGLSLGAAITARRQGPPHPRASPATGAAAGALRRDLGLAALAIAATPITGYAIDGAMHLASLPFFLRLALGTAAAYGPAFTALGGLAPRITRLALGTEGQTGRRVGWLQAVGTAGALAGSLLTAPVLLPRLTLPGAAWLVAAVLAAAATVPGPRRTVPPAGGSRRFLGSRAAAALLFAAALLAGPGRATLCGDRGAFLVDGPYARVVAEDDPEPRAPGRAPRRLLLDARLHGVQDPEDPAWVALGYAGTYLAATERLGTGPVARALCLGGGSYSVPRALLARGLARRVDVVEIDETVTAAARARLGLRDEPGLGIVHADARTFVRSSPPAPAWDLVYADAFGDLDVPWHLATVEHAREVHARMAPGGVFFANCIDVFDEGRFLAAYRATLLAVWGHVEVIGPSREDHAPRNFVLVASDLPLDLEGLVRPDPRGDDLPPLPVARYGRAELDALARRVGAEPLTDAYAPVEALLAPVLERLAPR